MNNFEFTSPTKVLFGNGSISKIVNHIPTDAKAMLIYGGGSIKKNGVYDDVMKYAKKFIICEFGGVEPNPHYETVMKALKVAKENKINFVLAVGGGSVIDGAKLLIAAMEYTISDEPWDMIAHFGDPKYAAHTSVKLGVVLTLPATGSETNSVAVITNVARKQKRSFNSKDLFPLFSVLDPLYTYSLSLRQVRNGITDAFAHVLEQYTAHFGMARLQDRQCEAIMRTLIDIAPGNLAEKPTYRDRADLMWCATKALDFHLGVGTVMCGGSHAIGHELTTFYGLDHGQTLAIIAPALLRKLVPKRTQKLAQMGRRVFDLSGTNDEEVAMKAIDKLEEFFRSLGQYTRLSEFKLDDSKFKEISENVRNMPFAHGDITDKETVVDILRMAL
jgi:NADP-dependent alcohol dehydrogenase